MRRRPAVELRMPRAVAPGQELRVSLKLTAAEDTPIRAVKLFFEGRETMRDITTYGVGRVVHEHPRKVELLALMGLLPKGSSAFQASFFIPASTPPTYFGTTIEHRYWVRVHVAIPWWIDLDESYDVVVQTATATRAWARPCAATSPKGSAPRCTLALPDQTYGPGDVIEGSVAFEGLGAEAVQRVDLSLVGYEKVAASERALAVLHEHRAAQEKPSRIAASLRDAQFAMAEVAEAHRFTALKAVIATATGESQVPFRFAIPPEAPPSFETPRAMLFWMFEAQLDRHRAASVLARAPITLRRFASPAPASAARPAVDVDRFRAAWSEAGARAQLTLEPAELALAGVIHGSSVLVRLGEGEAGKGGIVAELDYPSLGLGLSVQTRGELGFGIDLDDQPFGARFHASGREEAQTRAALGAPLRAALLCFDDVSLGDARALVRARPPGYEEPFIGRFLDHVQRLAAAIAEARTALPPPASMIDLVPAFTTFAASLGGRLELGSMSILDARFDGERFALITEFGSAALPERTVLALELDAPLPRPLTLAVPERGRAAGPSRSPGAARRNEASALVAELGRIGRSLTATDQAIRLELPAPLEDLAVVREAMAAMVALAETARRELRVGPYR